MLWNRRKKGERLPRWSRFLLLLFLGLRQLNCVTNKLTSFKTQDSLIPTKKLFTGGLNRPGGVQSLLDIIIWSQNNSCTREKYLVLPSLAFFSNSRRHGPRISLLNSQKGFWLNSFYWNTPYWRSVCKRRAQTLASSALVPQTVEWFLYRNI